MMTADWHLVLSRDGVVLGADGGAPLSWLGSRLDEHRADIPGEQPVHTIVVDALPLRRVPTDIRALCASALDVMKRQAAAFDVTLSLAVDDRVPALIPLDAEKIAWALTVLVGNALRYVHHGSQTMPGGMIAVRVTHNPASGEITIEVQDDGAGIPEDKLRFLFSVGPDQPRVGLGLSMIRDVVRAHAGRVDVRSETDQSRRGTTIRLTLPVS